MSYIFFQLFKNYRFNSCFNWLTLQEPVQLSSPQRIELQANLDPTFTSLILFYFILFMGLKTYYGSGQDRAEEMMLERVGHDLFWRNHSGICLVTVKINGRSSIMMVGHWYQTQTPRIRSPTLYDHLVKCKLALTFHRKYYLI